jgi:hypothetical protein
MPDAFADLGISNAFVVDMVASVSLCRWGN